MGNNCYSNGAVGGSSAPASNMQAYAMLFTIETVLRELVTRSLEKKLGTRWFEERLPADILKECTDGVEYERRIPWRRLVPHHPLYYANFPSLKKVILKGDNWRDVFASYFRHKEDVSSMLSDLEPIRNCVAHNRVVSQEDIHTLEEVTQKLTAALGASLFQELAASPTFCTDIPAHLRALLSELETGTQCCLDCVELVPLEAWDKAKHAWWFEDCYLGTDMGCVSAHFSLLEEYRRLPRRRGVGHLIEKWVRQSNVQSTSAAARSALLAALTKPEQS